MLQMRFSDFDLLWRIFVYHVTKRTHIYVYATLYCKFLWTRYFEKVLMFSLGLGMIFSSTSEIVITPHLITLLSPPFRRCVIWLCACVRVYVCARMNAIMWVRACVHVKLWWSWQRSWQRHQCSMPVRVPTTQYHVATTSCIPTQAPKHD